MQITAIKFTHYSTANISGFAEVQLDGVLWLSDIVIKLNEEGAPVVGFPFKTSKISGKQRPYYNPSGELSREIVAAIVEAYETWRNKHATND